MWLLRSILAGGVSAATGTTVIVSFTSGSGTWLCPTGVTTADYLVVGGGGGEWAARKVRLGLSDAGWTQVREGVTPGDVVSLIRPAVNR